MHQPKFELLEDKRHQFCFRLKAGSGKVVLQSESYKKEKDCLNGISSVQKNAVNPSRYTLKTSRRDEPFFVLTAPTGKVIGVSEMYSSPQKCKQGMTAVMRIAPIASIIGKTP